MGRVDLEMASRGKAEKHGRTRRRRQTSVEVQYWRDGAQRVCRYAKRARMSARSHRRKFCEMLVGYLAALAVEYQPPTATR